MANKHQYTNQKELRKAFFELIGEYDIDCTGKNKVRPFLEYAFRRLEGQTTERWCDKRQALFQGASLLSRTNPHSHGWGFLLTNKD